jgi:hypothetical protein
MCKWVVNEIAQPIPIAYAADRNDVSDEKGTTPRTLEAVRALLEGSRGD